MSAWCCARRVAGRHPDGVTGGNLVVVPRWRARVVAAAGCVAATVAIAGCTSAASDPKANVTAAGSTAVPSPSSPAPASPAGATAPNFPAKSVAGPVRLMISPASNAKDVSPSTPVLVAVARGHLFAVRLTDAGGKKVSGALAADRTSWRVAEHLGYGKKYTLTVRAVGADGRTVQKEASFTTLSPGQQATPYFNTTAGLALDSGETYGVGMIVNVHWDAPITDRAAAERTLAVRTAPSVTGSWYWADAQNVHWRPEHYYRAGTKVAVTISDYGKRLGAGLYGADDKKLSFTIGDSRISIADDSTHHVKVYENGKLVRDMPTSMGRGGAQVIKGRTITYWTPRSTYTVIGHANPVLMDSTTYGLPLSQGGYKEYIYYATRISTGGIYLHQMSSTVWAQGHQDVSHGCLNLSPANAMWFYRFSRVGDVVTVEHTGGAPLQVWQNGDWSVPWARWKKGSAL